MIVSCLAWAMPAQAEDANPAPSRGALTGLGMGLLMGSAIGLGAGLAGVVTVTEGDTRLKAYAVTQVQREQAPGLNAVLASRQAGVNMITYGFIGGGVALAGAIVCLVVDAPRQAPAVSISLSGHGGALVFSGRF